MKRQIDPIFGERVRLRLLREKDLSMTLDWRNQDHIRKWFFHSETISAEQHRSWFEQYKGRDDDFLFIIEETQTFNRPVGQISIYNIDWASRRGEYGRLLIGDRKAQGLGLAREATLVLVDALFREWGLREVYLEVKSSNLAAIRVYEGSGFNLISSSNDVLVYSKGSAGLKGTRGLDEE